MFYSWQTDTPAKVNRNFIEDVLERALEQIKADAEVVAAAGGEVVLDQGTPGVPGTPPIVQTILDEIDRCHVFVPDPTFGATTPAGRQTPNANVPIEYGWALKSKGHATRTRSPSGPSSWNRLHSAKPVSFRASSSRRLPSQTRNGTALPSTSALSLSNTWIELLRPRDDAGFERLGLVEREMAGRAAAD